MPPTVEFGEFWVEKPEVEEVLDLRTGAVLRHDKAIGTDYEAVIKLRSALQESIQREEPLYACSMCRTPVYLVSQKRERRFFFRHTLEDDRCSAKTRGLLSQEEIDARRYNGVKESQAHINMKNWVAESLRADLDFSHVEVEQRWTGKFDGEWRKPDVRAMYKGMPVVFEIQLSTTYLNVITARRSFYQREGALLIWVFAEFDEGPRRLTQDDVFFTNNRNAFVVSEATRSISIERWLFHLECIWAYAFAPPSHGLQRQVVPFEELTLDTKQQRAYFFDFDGDRERLLDAAQDDELARLAPLRDGFERWYIEDRGSTSSEDPAYAALRDLFEAEGVPLPWYPMHLPDNLLKTLYSAKHGRPIGWYFRTFMEVLHHVHGKRKYLRVLRRALVVYKRGNQILLEDKNRKWRAKVKQYTPLLEANDPRYEPDRSHDALVRILFPAVLDARAAFLAALVIVGQKEAGGRG
jgi:hypothetical protein